MVNLAYIILNLFDIFPILCDITHLLTTVATSLALILFQHPALSHCFPGPDHVIVSKRRGGEGREERGKEGKGRNTIGIFF